MRRAERLRRSVAKRVPVWLRQPMNRAQGCVPVMTNCHVGGGAVSPVHVRAANGDPLCGAGRSPQRAARK